MTRAKIAFVASGGAARGLAHLGVLRACEELGLLPEIFVGTSAGAIVGAMYAQDIPLDVLMDGYRLPWRRRHNGPRLGLGTFLSLPAPGELRDPGHLVSGLLSIRKFERYMRRHLPINSFERLNKSVYCPMPSPAAGIFTSRSKTGRTAVTHSPRLRQTSCYRRPD